MAKKGMNRREFLGASAFGLLSTRLGFPLLKTQSSQEEQPYKIIYRTLGKTGLRIPLISFGVMNSDKPALLHKALEMGIKHFDTAHGYLRGNSEKVIGEVLEQTGQREKVYIATKMRFARDKGVFLKEGDGRDLGANEENFNALLDKSLERLRTDYVDILYLHSCDTPQMVTFEPLMNILVKTKKSGKARFVGVSIHSNEPEVIRAAVDAGIYDVVLTAYNIMQEYKEDVKKAIQYAAEKNVGIVAMKTLGGNRLNRDTSIEIDRAAALKWVLGDENVCTAIPGMTTFEQMEFNFKVMGDLSLTESEKREVKLASMLSGTLYCQNCRYCLSSCPSKVEIPVLMRAFMYEEGYGNHIQAELTVAELHEEKGLKVCRTCSSCTASCRYGKDIPDRLKYLLAKGFDRC